MYTSVAAIRGTRTTPRFIRAATRGREARLGLSRSALTRPLAPARSGLDGGTAALVRRLRASRGMVIAVRAERSSSLPLRARESFRWSRGASGLARGLARRPRLYRAAPWRS